MHCLPCGLLPMAGARDICVPNRSKSRCVCTAAGKPDRANRDGSALVRDAIRCPLSSVLTQVRSARWPRGLAAPLCSHSGAQWSLRAATESRAHSQVCLRAEWPLWPLEELRPQDLVATAEGLQPKLEQPYCWQYFRYCFRSTATSPGSPRNKQTQLPKHTE